MKAREYSTTEIFNKLLYAEELMADGLSMDYVLRQIELDEATYERWVAISREVQTELGRQWWNHKRIQRDLRERVLLPLGGCVAQSGTNSIPAQDKALEWLSLVLFEWEARVRGTKSPADFFNEIKSGLQQPLNNAEADSAKAQDGSCETGSGPRSSPRDDCATQEPKQGDGGLRTHKRQHKHS